MKETTSEFQRLEEITSEFQGLKKDFNVWKKKVIIPMFERNQSVYFKVGKESGQNSSVVTDKVRIPMFGRIRSEL